MRSRHTMGHEDSVHRSMRRQKFGSKVQASFARTVLGSILPFICMGAVCFTYLWTWCLRTTGFVVVAIAMGLSLAYALWYLVTYLFVYVIIYIQKVILVVVGKKPPNNEKVDKPKTT